MMGRSPGSNGPWRKYWYWPWRWKCFVLIAPFFMQWVVDFAIVSADRDLLTILAFGLRASGAGTNRDQSGTPVHGAVPGDPREWLGANVFTHLMRLP